MSEVHRDIELEARLGKTETEQGAVIIPLIKMQIPIMYYTPEEGEEIETAIKLALEARGFEINE